MQFREENFSIAGRFPLAAGQDPEIYDMSDPESPDMPGKLKNYLAHYPPIPKNRTTPYWEYGPYGIWGLTARILVKVQDHFRKEETAH